VVIDSQIVVDSGNVGKFGVRVRAVTDCKAWLSLTVCLAAVLVFDCVGKASTRDCRVVFSRGLLRWRRRSAGS